MSATHDTAWAILTRHNPKYYWYVLVWVLLCSALVCFLNGRHVTLQERLATVERVSVESMDHESVIGGTNRATNPAVIFGFRHAYGFHTVPKSKKFDVAVMVVPRVMEHAEMLKYSLKTGEIGSGGEWSYLLAPAKDWIASQVRKKR